MKRYIQHNTPDMVYTHTAAHTCRGGALIYILIAIAILGTLTATLVENSTQQARAKKAFQLTQRLEGQIEFLKSAIQECVINYPGGDPTINPGTTVDDDYRAPYPPSPVESHYTGSTLGPEADNALSGIRCPGNPGIDHNHTPIFGPTTGRYFPNKADQQLGNWYYSNGSDTIHGEAYEGIFFQLGTASTEGYILDAFQRLEAKYGDCEFDYRIGSGTNGCGSGNCIRVWLVRVTPAC